jgi:hypothetical protein
MATFSQEAKVPVNVEESGNDSVGQRLAFAVREKIRASAGYKLVEHADSRVTISIVSLDPEHSEGSPGLSTAASIAFTMTNLNSFQRTNPQTYYPIFLTHLVMVVGSARVNEQAESILAALDKTLEDYKAEARWGALLN